RLRQRQARSQPLAAALKAWAEMILLQLSGGSDLAKAFRYMLVRWTALVCVFGDGRIALDNNPAERALQSVATGVSLYATVTGADIRAVAFCGLAVA
ncbi:IS66 family transposase, partial [Methylobacterium sp. J-030]|uniref:IS66 family transposase n=1 Tax=Methylobacterium sp. J-030 TaxID=2836627 RepID=UPI001FBBB0E4